MPEVGLVGDLGDWRCGTLVGEFCHWFSPSHLKLWQKSTYLEWVIR